MLPYDRSGVIFSLSQVQTFLGDEGGYRPLQTPKTENYQPPDVTLTIFSNGNGKCNRTGKSNGEINDTMTEHHDKINRFLKKM
jgi:hypothetical protein